MSWTPYEYNFFFLVLASSSLIRMKIAISRGLDLCFMLFMELNHKGLKIWCSLWCLLFILLLKLPVLQQRRLDTHLKVWMLNLYFRIRLRFKLLRMTWRDCRLYFDSSWIHIGFHRHYYCTTILSFLLLLTFVLLNIYCAWA